MARPPGTWTDEADAELRRLVGLGLSRVKIGEAMGISRHAVMYRMRVLDLHSGVVRTEAQRANMAAVIAEKAALEAELLAEARAYEALGFRNLARLVAEMTANLRAEQDRVEQLILDGGPKDNRGMAASVKLPNPVSDVREMTVSMGIAHDKMAAFRKEDRETSMASEGGDRISELVRLYTADAPPYNPDGAV